MKNNSGFTLVELMIVVLIIGILAAIAVPSYQEAVRESRRAVAGADLVELASDLERYYTTNNSYTGATVTFNESPQEGIAKFYDLAVVVDGSGAGFGLTAIPKNGQATDICGTLTFDSTDTKGAALITGCW